MTPAAYLRGLAWVRAVHLGFGFAGAGVAAQGWLPAGLSFAPLLLVSAVATAAAAPVLRGLQGRSQGDGMLEDGRRVDPVAWQWLAGLETAETAALILPLVTGIVAPVAAAELGLAVAGLFIGLIGLAWVRLLLAARWTMFQALRANNLLHTGNAPLALRVTTRTLAAGWVGADQKRIVQGIDADARLQNGDLAGHDAALEALWTGALDVHAFPLAIVRLGRDDPALARQVLAAASPRTLLDRRALGCLRAYVRIVEGGWDPGLDAELAALVDELPPRFADTPLRLLAAGRQQAGDGDGARDAIARVSRADHTTPWFAASAPRLATLLADAIGHRRSALPAAVARAEPLAPPTAPAASDPFAPPKGAPSPPGRLPVLRGAVPFEFAGLALRSRSWLPWPREAQLAMRVGAAVMLVPSVALLLMTAILSGDLLAVEGLLLPLLGVVPLALALIASAIAPAIELFAPRTGPRVVLDDGSGIAAAWWEVYRWAELGGGALLGLAIGSSGFAIASTLQPPGVHPAWFTLPMGLLLAVAGIGRSRVQRAAAAVLFGDARAAAVRLDAAVGANPALRPGLAVWRGAAWLRAGEPDRAADAWRAVLTVQPRASELLAWLDVNRDAVDIDRALGSEPQAALGPATRLAIFQGLVAARHGLGPRVAPRLAGWIQLAWTVRNPFGDLLALIIAAVRLPAGGDPWEGLPPVDPAPLAWAVTAWPFLAGARDAAVSAPR